jgi:hypothetical protein
MDCPIIAHPPMPPKKPVTVLATPCATYAWRAPPRWFVMSPTRLSVSRLSIRPMAARFTAQGIMISKFSQGSGTIGI